MANKQVHADLGEEEFQAFVRAVHRAGLSVGEAVRQATLAWVAARVPEAESIVAQAEKELGRPIAPIPRANDHVTAMVGQAPGRG